MSFTTDFNTVTGTASERWRLRWRLRWQAVLIRAALTTLAAFATFTPALAQDPDECTCLWRGSFAEVAANTDLVVLGSVAQTKGNAVDLALEDILLGDTWKQDIRVWMKARYYCRPEAELFKPGSRWIMALNHIDDVPKDGFDPSTPNISYGRKGDYILSSCGGYFLEVQGNTAIGNLVPDMPRWAYKPDMTPVILSLIKGYLGGSVSLQALITASEENPDVKNLMLDTKSFLRGQDGFFDEQ